MGMTNSKFKIMVISGKRKRWIGLGKGKSGDLSDIFYIVMSH